MNEVTRIHLGRQPFTISSEAHSSLKAYLSALGKQVGDKEVLEEIELRMAELLSERGITGDKVVLASDVDYLKEQLGNPSDFEENDEVASRPIDTNESGQKRLFRDTDNAILAGVSSGVANYFGIDAVIVRIIFFIAIITGGWGLLLYIALWLIVPEAKTSSDKLQMHGIPVTVEGLKEAVERADIKGSANRANQKLLPYVNPFFKFVVKATGLIFILSGLALIFALIASKLFLSLNNGQIFHENLFPVGTNEQVLLNLGLTLAAMVGLFSLIFGLAIFRRKWPIRTWVTGILIGVFMLGSAISIALIADVAPKVRSRYEAASQVETRIVQPFSNIIVLGDEVAVDYEYAESYSLDLKYLGDPDVSKIKTTVANGVLEIDSREFDSERECRDTCIIPTYHMRAVVKSPNARQLESYGDNNSGRYR